MMVTHRIERSEHSEGGRRYVRQANIYSEAHRPNRTPILLRDSRQISKERHNYAQGKQIKPREKMQ
jgi:hypothetical protein